ncbi:MAG: uroporphyrinogen-III synthase [Sphingomonadales bacterium]|nr:uroporphyrinogen-III synthase [Sphingomonadales bacterium]
MSLPLIVLRPEPGCTATVTAARAQGLDARGFPLHAIRATPWTPVAREAFDALLIGSANALRHAGPALAGWRGAPAYVVGEATAAAARDAGLEVVGIGGNGLQSTLGLLDPRHRRLLRLAGRERILLAPPDGVTVIDREVYASEPVAMPRGLIDLLRDAAVPGVVVALHAGAAARHFAGECARLGIDRGRITLVAIGPRVAALAGAGWAASPVAARADDAALLALAGQLCQKRAEG